jgi:hypothetical protein
VLISGSETEGANVKVADPRYLTLRNYVFWIMMIELFDRIHYVYITVKGGN